MASGATSAGSLDVHAAGRAAAGDVFAAARALSRERAPRCHSVRARGRAAQGHRRAHRRSLTSLATEGLSDRTRAE
ncbi:MAG: hypothetical protein ACK56I_07680, partial [bacterium]